MTSEKQMEEKLRPRIVEGPLRNVTVNQSIEAHSIASTTSNAIGRIRGWSALKTVLPSMTAAWSSSRAPGDSPRGFSSLLSPAAGPAVPFI